MKFTLMLICKHQEGSKKNITIKFSFTLIMLFDKLNMELLMSNSPYIGKITDIVWDVKMLEICLPRRILPISLGLKNPSRHEPSQQGRGSEIGEKKEIFYKRELKNQQLSWQHKTMLESNFRILIVDCIIILEVCWGKFGIFLALENCIKIVWCAYSLW